MTTISTTMKKNTDLVPVHIASVGECTVMTPAEAYIQAVQCIKQDVSRLLNEASRIREVIQEIRRSESFSDLIAGKTHESQSDRELPTVAGVDGTYAIHEFVGGHVFTSVAVATVVSRHAVEYIIVPPGVLAGVTDHPNITNVVSGLTMALELITAQSVAQRDDISLVLLDGSFITHLIRVNQASNNMKKVPLNVSDNIIELFAEALERTLQGLPIIAVPKVVTTKALAEILHIIDESSADVPSIPDRIAATLLLDSGEYTVPLCPYWDEMFHLRMPDGSQRYFDLLTHMRVVYWKPHRAKVAYMIEIPAHLCRNLDAVMETLALCISDFLAELMPIAKADAFLKNVMGVQFLNRVIVDAVSGIGSGAELLVSPRTEVISK